VQRAVAFFHSLYRRLNVYVLYGFDWSPVLSSSIWLMATAFVTVDGVINNRSIFTRFRPSKWPLLSSFTTVTYSLPAICSNHVW
jgi:hypothetical protein